MHAITVNYPTDWENARLYILSDLHIGDPNTNMADIHSQIEQIKNDPNGLFILNGDLINAAVRNSVSDIYSEGASPMEQLQMAIDLFSPIKEKLIGATSGNHEDRIWKNDGIDVTKFICAQLKADDKYDPDGLLIFLRFGRRDPHGVHKKANPRVTYTIYMSHGRCGGRKEGAKAIRLADMASIVDADVYIHSHTHLPMAMVESYYRAHESSRSIEKVDKLFVNAASSVNYGGYSQKNEYKPSAMRHPVISLAGSKKFARAIL